MIEWCVILVVSIICWFGFFWKINYVKGLKNNLDSGGVRLRNRKIGEIPPVYPNGWFCLLESSQLKKGQVKHVAALGENFAVFRTKEGNVNIIDAYCPHLGANMAEGGRVLDDGCLECPFHNWTFRGDGQCQNIPYTKIVPPTMKTKSWKCCEVNQLIFVWYHAESIDPEWYIEPVLQISKDKWQYQGRNEFLINSHIQEIPENGADWAHLNPVHGRGMFANEMLPNLSHHLWSAASWTLKQSLNNSEIHNSSDNNCKDKLTNEKTEENDEIINNKHRASVKLQHDLIVGGKFSIIHLDIEAEQIGPGYVELNLNSALGPMCILQTVTPIKPLLQRVTHTFFAPLIISPYAKIVFIAECYMFERDIAIWNHKKFQKNPCLVREDRRISEYRRWYSQFYSPSSPKYNDLIKSLDW
ncbi:hypothetical protein PV327_006328 [Microctonus hyperodae]|uniref:cholesterol 7-desaturase n=1 Tax=Microctonus hyperodae TaxID=165561 RepID=A0AA39F435_MICHY|nr:hypothetical protein PV327_006328 [Microctonus hyperodae]